MFSPQTFAVVRCFDGSGGAKGMSGASAGRSSKLWSPFAFPERSLPDSKVMYIRGSSYSSVIHHFTL